MQTTNDRMTKEQVTDLLNLAAHLQAKAESSDDRDTAVMAYAVQRVCLELTESRPKTKVSEQQIAAVVAENTGLKNFINTDCFVAHVEPETFYEEEVTRYVSADGYEPETPATDAAIANIQAQGVEMFAHSMAHHLLVMEKNGEDAITKIQAGTASRLALAFAAQLRQGAKS